MTYPPTLQDFLAALKVLGVEPHEGPDGTFWTANLDCTHGPNAEECSRYPLPIGAAECQASVWEVDREWIEEIVESVERIAELVGVPKCSDSQIVADAVEKRLAELGVTKP